MACNNGRCGSSACSCFGIIISILVGAAVGILFAFDLIPNIVTVMWIIFGIAAAALLFYVLGVILGAVTAPNALSRCLCSNNTCLLVGIIGTLVSAIVALSITLDFTLIAVITVVAIVAFFFTLMVIGIISLLSCITCRVCSHPDNK